MDCEESDCIYFKQVVLNLRVECGKYQIRFLEELTGLRRATINRFINGNDPKLSTVLSLVECVNDAYYGCIEDKYKEWKSNDRGREKIRRA